MWNQMVYTLRAQYLKNGLRYRLRFKGPPIGNGPQGIEWSCDQWRHVTQKGQIVTRIPLESNIANTVI